MGWLKQTHSLTLLASSNATSKLAILACRSLVDLPMQWMLAAWPATLIQALLMTKFLAVLSGWILKIEKRDVAAVESRTPQDRKDVLIWQDVKSRFEATFRSGLAFIVLSFAWLLAMRFFAAQVFQAIAAFGGPIMLVSIFAMTAGLIWGLLLLMFFSRSIYRMKMAFKDRPTVCQSLTRIWNLKTNCNWLSTTKP